MLYNNRLMVEGSYINFTPCSSSEREATQLVMRSDLERELRTSTSTKINKHVSHVFRERDGGRGDGGREGRLFKASVFGLFSGTQDCQVLTSKTIHKSTIK